MLQDILHWENDWPKVAQQTSLAEWRSEPWVPTFCFNSLTTIPHWLTDFLPFHLRKLWLICSAKQICMLWPHLLGRNLHGLAWEHLTFLCITSSQTSFFFISSWKSLYLIFHRIFFCFPPTNHLCLFWYLFASLQWGPSTAYIILFPFIFSSQHPCEVG